MSVKALREPVDVEQWDHESCGYAVAWQVAHMLGLDVPAFGEGFKREVERECVDPRLRPWAATEIYLNRRGVEQLCMDVLMDPTLTGPEGYEVFIARYEAERGRKAARKLTKARYEEALELSEIFEAAVDMSRLRYDPRTPSEADVRELLADGWLVELGCDTGNVQDGGAIHVVLAYGVEGGFLKLYDPWPTRRSTLIEIPNLSSWDPVVCLEAFRLP